MRSISIELEPGTNNKYRVLLRMDEKSTPEILGEVIDHKGWAIGTCRFERGEIDADKVEDVVTIIISRAADVISNRLVG
jgi:hypothetical protein